jgi:hypothetical protein
MSIKPGDTAEARATRNISVAEDEAPILVIKAGDRLVATSAADANGFQTFIHLPSSFENVTLHKDDVIPA